MVIYISNELHLYISKNKQKKRRTNRKQWLENYVQNVQTTRDVNMRRKWEKYSQKAPGVLRTPAWKENNYGNKVT